MRASNVRYMVMVLSFQLLYNKSVSQSISEKAILKTAVNENTVTVEWRYENEAKKFQGLIIQLVRFDPKRTSIYGLGSGSVKFIPLTDEVHSGKCELDLDRSENGLFFLKIVGVKPNGEFDLIQSEILEI